MMPGVKSDDMSYAVDHHKGSFYDRPLLSRHAAGGHCNVALLDLVKLCPVCAVALSPGSGVGRWVLPICRGYRRRERRFSRAREREVYEECECKSGHPIRVGYSDTACVTGVAMRRARTRAWVVWGDIRCDRAAAPPMRVDQNQRKSEVRVFVVVVVCGSSPGC